MSSDLDNVIVPPLNDLSAGDGPDIVARKVSATITKINDRKDVYIGPGLWPVNFFKEAGLTEAIISNWYKIAGDPGSHQGVARSAWHIESRPTGSGRNGPGSADIGLTVSQIKKGWTGQAPTSGELDGIYVALRQSGPDSDGAPETNSDCGAFVADVATRGNVGFGAVLEGISSNIDRTTFAATAAVNVQIAPVNKLISGSSSYGYVANAVAGTNTTAFYAFESDGIWSNFFVGRSGNRTTVKIDREGRYNGVTILSGAGSPEGIVSANAPTLYLRTDPGPNTAIYIKVTGAGATGWVALAAAAS